jgi:hypothetical protein
VLAAKVRHDGRVHLIAPMKLIHDPMHSLGVTGELRKIGGATCMVTPPQNRPECGSELFVVMMMIGVFVRVPEHRHTSCRAIILGVVPPAYRCRPDSVEAPRRDNRCWRPPCRP